MIITMPNWKSYNPDDELLWMIDILFLTLLIVMVA